MTATEADREPSWCRKSGHEESVLGLHRSAVLRAGRPGRFNGGRGEVSVWLEAADGGPTWVAVNAALMISATVEVTLGEARRLRDHLDLLIKQAGAETGSAGTGHPPG